MSDKNGSNTARYLLVAVGLVAVVALASYFLVLPRGGQTDEVRVGILLTDHQAAGHMAADLGYFEEEGVNVELVTFSTGAPETEALVSGSLDMGFAGTPIMTAIARGAPLKVVSGIHRVGSMVVGGPDVNGLEQLRGEKVAVFHRGTIAHTFLLIALDSVGVSSEEVQVVEIASPQGILTALQRGEIQAASVWEPWGSQVLSKGDFNLLAEPSEVWPGYQDDVLVAKTSFIEERPDLVRKVVRAVLRATNYINENPEDAAMRMARILEVELEVERQSMSNIVYTPIIERESLYQQYDFMVQFGLLNEEEVPSWERFVHQEMYDFTADTWSDIGGG